MSSLHYEPRVACDPSLWSVVLNGTFNRSHLWTRASNTSGGPQVAMLGGNARPAAACMPCTGLS